MVNIYVCIDFDRDYALPITNIQHAISHPLREQTEDTLNNPISAASLKGTIESFESFINLLTDFNIPSTFYFEARSLQILKKINPNFISLLKRNLFEHGLHGFDHEDLTGEETGIVFDRANELRVIKEAQSEVESILDTTIFGFRAPYMRHTKNTFSILNELKIRYDSSLYTESDKAIKPYEIYENLIEFPVIKTPKLSTMKGMYTYLWPLFEGKREVEEVVNNYCQLVKNSKEDDSFISINLHSWHFSYNISQSRYLSKLEVEENINIFRNLITKLQETGNVSFSTPKNWLKKNSLI
jgi:peptidoglycan/xylan/chitin deacetylase (PgdA/CDA1 family)